MNNTIHQIEFGIETPKILDFDNESYGPTYYDEDTFE